MFRVALLVIVYGCLIRVAPSLPSALTQPESLAAMVLLAWVVSGPFGAIAVATIAWSVANIGWAMEERLDPVLSGADIVVTGTICDFPRVDGRARRFVFHAEPDPDGVPLPARLYLASYDALNEELEGGQRWRLMVRLKRPRGLSNPGGFDFERWALERRIGATGYVRKSSLNSRLDPSTMSCPTIVPRQQLATAIERSIDDRHDARFLLALAIGARHQIRQEDWTLMRRTGTVHLMAISGLHVGIVAGLMWWLGRVLASVASFLGLLRSTFGVARVFALTGAFAYAAMAGFAVPTLRAFVMVAIVTLAVSSRRCLGPWQVLSIAAIAVNWVDPFAMLGSGFWLSFGAVSCLLAATLTIRTGDGVEGVPGPRYPGRRLRLLAGVQISLSIGLAPLAVMFFAEVSLVSPIVNLLVVPVFTIVVVPLTLFGTASLVFGAEIAAPLLDGVSAALAHGMALLAQIGRWPGAAWQVTLPGAGWLGAACVSAVLFVWPAPLRGRIVGVLLLILIAGRILTPSVPSLRIIVMDVGQGLAVLVQTPGHALLYDAGPAFGHRDSGQTVVLPVLRSYGIGRLDTVVVSHGDNDHLGGMRTVLDAFPNATLIAPAGTESLAGDFRACVSGESWRWDNVEFRILGPRDSVRASRSSDNNRSCVLSVLGLHASVLLPGDIERSAELDLVASGDLGQHDIVIAPHHGSATSSSGPFISAVAPRLVVFATRLGNRWGFPEDGVVRRWRRTGACLLDTGVDGALIFEIDSSLDEKSVIRHRVNDRHVWREHLPVASTCAAFASTNYHDARL